MNRNIKVSYINTWYSIKIYPIFPDIVVSRKPPRVELADYNSATRYKLG